MAHPLIQSFAISNVFSRIMHFVNAGDVEVGHTHTYDHATLVSSGSVRYEVLDEYNGNVVYSRDFVAPTAVYVEKDKYHRLVALEPNTVCACIHALRTIDENLVPPNFFIKPEDGNPEDSQIIPVIKNRLGVNMKPFIGPEHAEEAKADLARRRAEIAAGV
jgi:hypothetical protein